MEENEKLDRARKRVRSLRDFYGHLIIYLIINAFLLIVNLISTPDRLWFYWVTLGWGVAVILNAIAVFGIGGIWGSEWEDKKIKQILEKESHTPQAG